MERLAESGKLVLSVVGLILIIEGLPYLLFPSRMKGMIKYLLESDDRLLRVIGVALTVLGIGLILLVRSCG
jgi:uncharacterized protein YjeT (DUF2065 family)